MKNKTITILSLLTLCHFSAIAQSNEGREFWFGFMEHFDTGLNTMVAMITSKTAASGTIEMPLQKLERKFQCRCESSHHH